MSLDSRIRSAVAETVGAPPDVEEGLTALRRTRQRRVAARFGACAVVLALVLTGVVLRRHDTRPEPAPTPGPVRNGIVLGLSLGGTVEQLGGRRLPTLPSSVDPDGPFQFTPDGHHLVYARDRFLLSRDLETGQDRTLAPCPNHYCFASIDPTGTRVVSGHGHRLTLRDLASGGTRHYDVGRPFGAVAWSSDGGTAALVTHRGRDESLSVLNLDSGEVTRVLELPGGLFAVPALSPNGSQLAYIRRVGRGHGMPRLTLVTVATDTGRQRDLHEVGRCYCMRYFPAITWSPDASRIAVTLSGTPVRGQVGGAVYSVRPDGTDWRLLGDGNYQDRLAWQPIVTDED